MAFAAKEVKGELKRAMKRLTAARAYRNFAQPQILREHSRNS
jgi:hypothetical protein